MKLNALGDAVMILAEVPNACRRGSESCVARIDDVMLNEADTFERPGFPPFSKLLENAARDSEVYLMLKARSIRLSRSLLVLPTQHASSVEGRQGEEIHRAEMVNSDHVGLTDMD